MLTRAVMPAGSLEKSLINWGMLSLLGFARHEDEPLGLNKPTMLLVYLAHQQDWVSRDELVFLLKPDETEKAAKNYVRVLLHRSKTLPLATTLELSQDRLRLPVATDTAAFKAALTRGDVEVALELYQAEFLQGFNAQSATEFEDWVYTEREQYTQRYLEALRHYFRTGQVDTAKALVYLERAIATEPYEAAWQRLYYQQLVCADQPASVQLAFRSYTTRLREDLGLEVDAVLAQEVAALTGEARDAPLRVVLDKPTRAQVLPRTKTAFFGREQELAALADQLLTSRFITLVGLGGSGKTRLALELGHHLKAELPYVYFVDLSEACSEEEVKTTVLATVDPQLLAHPDPWRQFKAGLAAGGLVILDNCEQLDDMTLLLSDLLEDCEGLKLLATSRQALGLSSEHLFDLSGLTLPPKEGDPADLPAFSAVALFMARVEQRQRSYQWTPKALEATRQIALLTDGMPLALELAAGWARLLPVTYIETELRSSLDILDAQYSDTHSRHQNIKTVFESSFARLVSKEQTVLLALSVFQGGWTLAAAKGVTSAHLPLLLSLTNRSLIRRDSNTRFSLHMLLRQWLLERAAAHPAYTTWQTRHAAYYLTAIKPLTGEALLRGLEADFDNFRAAWFYMLERDLQALYPTLKKFIIFIETSGRGREGEAFIERSISVLEKTAVTAGQSCLLAFLYAELAYLQVERGARESALETVELVLALLPQLTGYLAEQADCKMRLGFVYYRTGQNQKRLDITHSALADLEVINSKERAVCLRHLAGAYHAASDIETSRNHYQESIRLLRMYPDAIEDSTRQLAISLMNYGYLLQGHMQNENDDTLEEALAAYKEANEMFKQVGFVKGVGFGANNIASIYIKQGKGKEARPYLYDALKVAKKLGVVSLEIYAYIGLAKIILLLDQLSTEAGRQEAFGIMAKAKALSLEHNLQDLPHILMLYAELYRELGDTASVRQIYASLQNDDTLPPATKKAIRNVERKWGLELNADDALALIELARRLGQEVALPV